MVPPEKPWCESNYVKPDKRFITCGHFGQCDGMNDACHNCRDMTLYQWHMCYDALSYRMYRKSGLSHEQAKQIISDYKISLWGRGEDIYADE